MLPDHAKQWYPGDPSSAVAQGWGHAAPSPLPRRAPTSGEAGRVKPCTWLVPGPCCHFQHPSVARDARLETPRPLRQPPPAHELTGFLGLSLAREMSLRAENSPAKPCQGTRACCYSCSAWGTGNFMSDLVTLGPTS